MLSGIGWTEVLVVLAIVLLLFGGAKLPELARGSGRALRIFKTEVKALDDDKDKSGADSGVARPTASGPTPVDQDVADDTGHAAQNSIDQRRTELS